MATKQNRKANVDIRDDNTLRFNFTNGKTLTFDPLHCIDDIRMQLMLHGAKQKIADSYAGAMSVSEAIEAAEGIIEQLLAGEWNAKRDGGTGITLEAIARIQSITVDEAKAKWATLDEKTKKDIQSHPDVKAAVLEIRAERLAKEQEQLGDKKPDVSDLLVMFKNQAA